MKKQLFTIAIIVAFIAAPLSVNAMTNAEMLAQIQSLMQMVQQLQAQLVQVNSGKSPSNQVGLVNIDTNCLRITHFLKKGYRDNHTGGDVSKLQAFLKQQGVYNGLVGGYYGPATEKAVQSWQGSHGVVSYGAPSTTGYGVVGPSTRKKMACVAVNTFIQAVQIPIPYKYTIKSIIGDPLPIINGVKPEPIGGRYYKVGSKIEFDVISDAGIKLIELEGINIDKFEYFKSNNRFAHDDKLVFFDGNRIDAADASTFSLLGDRYSNYSKDAHNVFYKTRKISNDTLHFVVVNRDFARDSDRVYVRGDIVPLSNQVMLEGGKGADGGKCLPGKYIRGDSAVYFGGGDSLTKVGTLDSKNFEVINCTYAKDSNYIYHYGEVIPGADPDSYVHVGSYFYKDKYFVYIFGDKFNNSDPDSFVVLNDSFAQDNNFVYAVGKYAHQKYREGKYRYARVNEQINVDKESFHVIDDEYAEDKYYTYYFINNKAIIKKKK